MAAAKSGLTRETLTAMAEVSFHREIESLRLGAGETFYGEGILAVTKALLQSGVSYVGGYQGAPVSHLLDALVQSEGLLTDLGLKRRSRELPSLAQYVASKADSTAKEHADADVSRAKNDQAKAKTDGGQTTE